MATKTADKMSHDDLARIALDEIMRRLQEHGIAVQLVQDYATALTRAGRLIDFATDAQLNPAGYEGEMRRLLYEHQAWIEKQRAKGLFPRLEGTKAPVARPKRKTPK